MDKIHVHQESNQGSIRIRQIGSDSVHTAKIDTAIVTFNNSPYRGSYVVTPSDETQTLRTANCELIADIVINPIPSNYGKISWDGSTLRIT